MIRYINPDKIVYIECLNVRNPEFKELFDAELQRIGEYNRIHSREYSEQRKVGKEVLEKVRNANPNISEFLPTHTIHMDDGTKIVTEPGDKTYFNVDGLTSMIREQESKKSTHSPEISENLPI